MNDERTRRIQERAHSIWEREGHPHGRDAQHWAQAEQEIDAEEAAGAFSSDATTTARRQPKRMAVTKTVADTSNVSREQAADVSTEQPVKGRGRKPKAVTEDGAEAPKARRGRSKAAAEASADAPVKTRGRSKSKAVTEDGAEAPKAPRGRKAKAVPEEGADRSTAAENADPRATVVEEATDPNREAPQDGERPDEPTEAPEASRTAE